jgi:trans-aconitate 3-methyltransferase
MTSPNPTDPTFRSYSAAQAQAYAVERGSYPNELYDIILKYHTSTGGKLDQLLDVGCGPGNATRYLSVAFQHAIGIDPGTEMIAAARKRGGKTCSGDGIKFEIGPAEECSKINGVGAGTVDMLTAAMVVSQCLCN